MYVEKNLCCLLNCKASVGRGFRLEDVSGGKKLHFGKLVLCT